MLGNNSPLVPRDVGPSVRPRVALLYGVPCLTLPALTLFADLQIRFHLLQGFQR